MSYADITPEYAIGARYHGAVERLYVCHYAAALLRLRCCHYYDFMPRDYAITSF